MRKLARLEGWVYDSKGGALSLGVGSPPKLTLMSERRRIGLHVLPDAERVEHAMVQAASKGGLVDGRTYCTFAQLIDEIVAQSKAPRRLCSALTARILIGSSAQALPTGPFGDFVDEPAFARE